MATAANAVMQLKPLPAPNSDLYQLRDTLNAEERAHVVRVTTLGVLTASIAHEINRALSAIVTNASTCVRMPNADSPNIRRRTGHCAAHDSRC